MCTRSLVQPKNHGAFRSFASSEARRVKPGGFTPFSMNSFAPKLPNKQPSHRHFPPSLHMKEANHQRDLPFFTSDPADTRITALVPAPQTLNALPPIRRVPFPSRLTDEGSGGCQTALLVSPCAHQTRQRQDVLSFGNVKEKGSGMEAALT